jgi:starch synthase
MKICLAASESLPFIKTGGLADVIFSLSKALADRGHEVIIVLPRYYKIDKAKFNCTKMPLPLGIPVGFGERWASVHRSELISGVKSYFIEHDDLFGRDGLYDDGYNSYSDNALRFAFFSRAVLQLCHYLNFKPDVMHCNDWQTALIPLFIKTHYKNDPLFATTKSIMTIHNIGYQGVFNANDIVHTQLGWEYFNEDCLKFYDVINFLKCGILWSDAVTTVSRKYAEEIMNAEFGYDLAGVIRRRADDLFGITNGVDYSQWNPEVDPNIPAKFSNKDLSGKKLCKTHLQNELGLTCNPGIPLLATITRVTNQKGIDILIAALEKIKDTYNFQYVLLGTGDNDILSWYENLVRYNPERFAVCRKFDNVLSHKIESGADMYLMPSRYEPCGLNQMYSLKYGTIPIVRATGGLDDTITEWDGILGNGFKFNGYSSDSFAAEIINALDVFQDRKKWSALMKNAMDFNLSWNDVVLEYEQLYSVIKKK